MIGFLIRAVFSQANLVLPSITLFLCGIAGTWLFRNVPLRRVDFGSMQTFRDLVVSSVPPQKGAA